jgi:aspartokinase/homoserine dehydrogenase 1
MSANPRQVPEAQVLPGLSYREAMELAYFGAKVLHPSTIAPAVARDVVVWIKNTFSPEVPGTRIAAQTTPDPVVKGFASIDSMSLLNLEGSDLIGVPGIAERLFGALKNAGVSVVMISQGSSEHSICFVVPDHHADRAREVVERAFFAERHQGQLRDLQVTPGCSVLAAVGDGMSGTPGVAARFFTALANAGVSVRAIAQGSSERNISVVVDGPDAQRALRAAHAAHFLSPQTLSIGLIGAGGVGSELLSQLAREADHLRAQFDLSLRVRAICDSRRMLLDDAGVDLSADWRDLLAKGEPLDLDRLVAHVDAPHLPHATLVDCTSSQAVADRYLGWLTRGIHVITPNKKASSGDLDTWRALRAQRRAHYLHETTVGAGLPIVHTARELVQTGDRFRRVEGILSGTLSYLFNTYDAQTPFSELVRQARALGYTEPDPRDDLSGADVARKLVILSREAGADLSLDQVEVTSLVPDDLTDCSIDAFLEGLADHDDAIAARHAEAAACGEVLRFVGTFDAAAMTASVKLGSYPASHPLARVQKTDNIVQLTTDRYADNPLVIQGPGAGPGVTAAGVFADLLRLASYLGARR